MADQNIADSQKKLEEVKKYLNENEKISLDQIAQFQKDVENKIKIVDTQLRALAKRAPENDATVKAYTDTLRELQQMRHTLKEKNPQAPKPNPYESNLKSDVTKPQPSKKTIAPHSIPKKSIKLADLNSSPLLKLINSTSQGNKYIRPLINTYFRLREEARTGIKNMQAFENTIARMQKIIPQVQRRVTHPMFKKALNTMQQNVSSLHLIAEQQQKFRPER